MAIAGRLSKYVGYFGFAALIFSLGGCGAESDEYTFAPMIYDEETYLNQIAGAADLITLNEIRADYSVALKRFPAVDKALRSRWDLLAERVKEEGRVIGRLSDELELWAFDFEKLGKERHLVFDSRDNDRHRLYLLFRVHGPMEEDYGITLEGRIDDPSQLEEPYREKGYRWWHFNPLPPTTFWEEGEFIVVRQDISVDELPYQMRINFDTPRGRYGKQIPLGTMRKIEDLSVTEEEIVVESDPFRLSKWLSCCHARSGAKGELVRKRYRDLIDGLPVQAEAEEGIEYLGAQLERPVPGSGRLQLLFRVGKTIAPDYWVLLYGVVAPEDTEYLSEDRRAAGKKSEEWFLPLYPESSRWKEGEGVVVVQNLPLAPIPYTFSALFYDREDRKAGPLFEIGNLTAYPDHP